MGATTRNLDSIAVEHFIHLYPLELTVRRV